VLLVPAVDQALHQLSANGGELVFNLLTQLYERRGNIIIINLAFAEWIKGFGDEKPARVGMVPSTRRY
jgi:hypothetical protein